MGRPTPTLADPELPCHGCAHSASGAPYPGHPSGERPCCFCVRNPELEQWKADSARDRINPVPDVEVRLADGTTETRNFDAYEGRWYNGEKAGKNPQDNYIATDRLMDEIARSDRRKKGDTGSVIVVQVGEGASNLHG